jgi:hypothetical protein
MKQSILTITLSTFLFFSCGNESSSVSTVIDKEIIEVNDAQYEAKTSSIEEELSSNKSAPIETSDNITIEESSEIKKTEVATNEHMTAPIVPQLPVIKSEVPTKETIENKPNHTEWNNLLKKNVNSSGSVNYSNMKSSIIEIDAYISQLENLTNQSNWSRNEKLAYWINLYNAATIRLIVENYPIGSITDINSGEPWDKKVVTVGSTNYTLNQIENDIIRSKFNEPRIHFAVNCGAKSCPKLMNSAFTPDNLSNQLTKQAKSFINGTKNDISVNKIIISKIFEWYTEDFGASIIEYLNKYSTEKIEANTTIKYKPYNWDLNK